MKPNNKTVTNHNNKLERVKVYVRIRPFNDDELKIGGESSFKNIDTKNNVLSIKTDFFTKVYAYDGIYDEKSTQEEIFNISAKPVIDVRNNNNNNNFILYSLY